ncbi:MAG: ATP-dependent zinc protease family protein [Bacteroidales bacterium]
MSESLIVIGRRDRIDLPGLGFRNLKAKVDTGAYGSALHCSRIEVVKREGKIELSFVLLDPEHPLYKDEVHWATDFREKKVKSSSGASELRYIITTPVVIFGKRITTDFSLTDRSDMKYPVLLGRKFLRKRFMVDVRFRDLSYKLKRKKVQ